MEKEGFVFGVKLEDYSHWVNGGQLPSKLFTDHKNLLALFSDKVRPMTCNKPSRDKMTRWGITLMGMTYTIHHIDGIHNHLADLGSRWGNRFAKAKAQKAKERQHDAGLSGGPHPLMRELCTRPGHKKVLRAKLPKLTDDMTFPDQDCEWIIMPSEKNLVDRDRLAEEQQKHATTNETGRAHTGRGHPTAVAKPQRSALGPLRK